MLALLIWLGCVSTEYREADLQLDLSGEVPEEADRLRICVDGAGAREVGQRFSGLYSFTGLPPGAPLDIAVELISEASGLVLARAEVLDVTGLVEGELSSCEGDCERCRVEGSLVPAGQPDWLLAVRLLDVDAV